MERQSAAMHRAVPVSLAVCAATIVAGVVVAIVASAIPAVAGLSATAPSHAVLPPAPLIRANRVRFSLGVQLQGVATTPTTIASPIIPLTPTATGSATPYPAPPPAPSATPTHPAARPETPLRATATSSPYPAPQATLAPTQPSAEPVPRETPARVSPVDTLEAPGETPPPTVGKAGPARKLQGEPTPAALPTWLSLLVAVLLLIPSLLWYRSRRGETAG